ncbi:MAG TPA: PAS domain S-box protein, partial [Xanthomonadales bacterium]|nr:PAS domain S-box protein [Xanthomonadales bacterium]
MRIDDGAFVDVNPAFERVTGWSRAEALGKMPIELGIWQGHETRALIWGRLRTRQCIAGEEVTFFDRAGKPHHAVLSCELFELDGVAHVISLLQEVGDGAMPIATPVHAETVESYRSLFQSAAEGIYRSLPDGGFIDVNPAMARIFGYESPAAMITDVRGDAVRLHVDPTHGAWLRAELDARGRVHEARSRVRRRDGREIWISENARAVRDAEGRVLFYEGTVIDITDRLASDAALRQSEAMYKVLVDNCRDGVFLIQRGRVVFANRALSGMLGYAEEDLRGMEYLQLVAPDDRAAQSQRRSAREGGSTLAQDYEVHLLRRNGTQALFAVHADAVVYNGDIASTGVARDITEERARQRALEDAERKYRELFHRSPVGLFRTHPDGRVLEVNQSMAELLGYADPADVKARVADLASLYVDPLDRQAWIDRLRSEHMLRNLRAHIRKSDGTPIWVEVSVEMHERDGGVLFEGSVQDITQRVTMERALKRSEARYRNLIDHSQVGVYLMQGDRYVYVNAAFAQMVGRAESDILGLSYRELQTPASLAHVDERLARRARGEDVPAEYEIELRRSDGALVYAIVSAGFLDVDGERLVGGTMRDITRHRQAEQRLKFHATHDALTGMPNRLLFQQRLQDAMRASRKGDRHDYAVLYLDLDGFKLVNDSLGHAAGD